MVEPLPACEALALIPGCVGACVSVQYSVCPVYISGAAGHTVPVSMAPVRTWAGVPVCAS